MAIEAPIRQITGWQGKVRDFTLTTDGTGELKPGASSAGRDMPNAHFLLTILVIVIYLGL
ncbi:hypothetical protein LLEC1_00176 [Akanthomyces lecanii]|uniref:Uncharacterized protein n=1 Tax=Cordyceps confragosa TaxID=2714763 RepID=A0A179IF23_CORDF|nr:hypothetical protein LLEC1_00176 [Akanthomyces lecanii]